MRLASFIPPDGIARAGAVLGSVIIDLAAAAPLVLSEPYPLHWDMLSLLRGNQEGCDLDSAAAIVAAVLTMTDMPINNGDSLEGNGTHDQGWAGTLSIGGAEMLLPLTQVRVLAPLPHPPGLRLFETSTQHMTLRARLAGRPLPDAWQRTLAFGFGNHAAIYGPDEPLPYPTGSEALDYELEVACVIGRAGRDISPDEAAQYIAGYTIVNDWSARDLQADEDALGLGSGKAKDFATSLGPWLVTPDELALYADEDGHLLLTLSARVNQGERSRANLSSMRHPFPELIAHASRNALLRPGDILSSGAMGGCCLLEQTNGFGPWLAPGDSVELDVTGLGTLRTQIT